MFLLGENRNKTEILKATSLLTIVAFCLFEYVLDCHCDVFCDLRALLSQFKIEWMLFACIAVWSGFFIFLTFRLNDLPLICFLLVAVSLYVASYPVAWPRADAMALLVGITLGLGMRLFLSQSYRYFFIEGLIMLFALSSWCHLDLTNNPYHGPRWMGLWNDPNIYGMLMGTGVVLAVGLLTAKERRGPGEMAEHKADWAFSPRLSLCLAMRRWNILWSVRSSATIDSVILFIAAGMMTVGLFFSYSRGTWVGTAVSLFYLAKVYGKFKWRFVFAGTFVVVAVVCFFWHSTTDKDPWYLKRLDFSRASAQHRVSAWHGALQMMRDYPLGVGWNKAVDVYEKNYLPPEGGAAALAMNSYLMLGTELGLPALLCFIAYIYLKLKSKAADSMQVVCRAGTLVLLIAFWFDGGLFDLPTAALFWILLELGSVCRYGEVLHSPPS